MSKINGDIVTNINGEVSFHDHFGYGSILSIIIFLLGIEILVLFLRNNVSFGVLLMLFSLFLYIINNILLNLFNLKNEFNLFLENLATFLTFGITTVIYGIMYFENDLIFLVIIFVYAVCLILSLSRNNVSSISNSVGWPVALNGLFFPLVYFIYEFYLPDSAGAVFLLFYIIIATLLVSKLDFLSSK